MRNIILCGFMGCGKTTVGRKLAERIHRPFIDMDAWIEQAAGMTVSEIFERYGEEDFRRREREACRELATLPGAVIGSGGGALTFSENVCTLARTGDIVLLDVPLDVIVQRLQGDTTRPLLSDGDKKKAAQELYDRRAPLYRAAAAFAVDGVGQPDEVVCRILEALAPVVKE